MDRGTNGHLMVNAFQNFSKCILFHIVFQHYFTMFFKIIYIISLLIDLPKCATQYRGNSVQNILMMYA